MPLPVLPPLAFCAALFFFWTSSRRRGASRLPPGPPRDPLIGNLRQMPTEQAPLMFHEWGKRTHSFIHPGDVIYLQVPGRSIIILDSLQAAEHLFDKRSLIYSDRPKFPLFELFGWTSALMLLPYGKQLVKARQMHQSYLGRQKCADYQPMQVEEARTLVLNLLSSEADQYETFISRFATGILTQIVAGHRIQSADDVYLRISGMAMESMARAGLAPGSTPIDFFPFLRHLPHWFPGTHYAAVAAKWRPTVRELYEFPIRTVSVQKATGEAKRSFLLTQLEEMEAWPTVTAGDEEDLKGTAAAMFTAGESTMWSALSMFVLAMVLHPECQREAHEEINSVVGTARLPQFSDREALPFVECVYQEVLRWHPVVPLGLPHRCMQGDHYRGMFIPAGSLVFANLRGMTLDESIYADPTSFNPKRYLAAPAGNAEPHFPGKFGFGRRVCTGQHLADNSVWVAIATILACCEITNAVDGEGNPIVPEEAVSYGLNSHPKDFQCVIRPRTAEVKTLIEEGMSSP
ncbi:cytochrome P450 [Mycena olivaceomarginata]|nr:cytochrome P450 [Mycena olivaceomarginata]